MFRNTHTKEHIDREAASKIGRGVRMLLGWNPTKMGWKWMELAQE